MIIRPRCHYCIDELHHLCLVMIMMGLDNRRGRPKERHSDELGKKKGEKIRPYAWKCGCGCDYARGIVSAGLED